MDDVGDVGTPCGACGWRFVTGVATEQEPVLDRDPWQVPDVGVRGVRRERYVPGAGDQYGQYRDDRVRRPGQAHSDEVSGPCSRRRSPSASRSARASNAA